jgi:NAD(P)-dependent dehydrogenase (short-subunit alcohol dehydrogenase family)
MNRCWGIYAPVGITPRQVVTLMKFADKVAVITGGSSGIGRAAAIAFAQEGAKVAVIDRNLERSQNTLDEIVKTGGTGMIGIADVVDAEQMSHAFQNIANQYQKIDIVFANAGVNGVWAPIEDIEPYEWEQTINVNLKGTFLTAKYGVPYLKEQGGSIIINSSINGSRSFSKPGATAYACTKAAQISFAKMLAVELADYRVRVNVICPGRVETGIEESAVHRNLDRIPRSQDLIYEPIPLTENQPGRPEEIAELVLFLASDAARFITGTEVWIDGGSSLL